MELSENNCGYEETEWVEMKSDNSDDGFGGMFDDPDPFETFTYTFKTITEESIIISLQGHRAENGQTLNSTGLTLWRAAPILCNFLLANTSNYVTNKVICELGAGLGLCSILAGALGASCVYVTDGDSASLHSLRENVERNSAIVPCSKINCRQLRWGMHLGEFIRHCSADLNPEGRFDVIMGSDIIYVESILDPLFQTVDALLSTGSQGAFILAYARRNVKIDLVLSTATRYGFVWEQPDGEEGCFVFSRLLNTSTADRGV